MLVFSYTGFAQDVYLSQRNGKYQNKQENHIAFYKFKEFQPELDKVTFREITKLIIYDGIIFILDRSLNQISVLDKEANYLYKIGRPGQGPGDLEYPSDFFISKEGSIYVINSMAKRIEVFSMNGNFKERISLNLPEYISYSHPSSVLITQDLKLIISYSLSPNLIDIYDSQGNFERTILKRKEKLNLPGQNIGNCSQISFLDRENSILHFNYFTGEFTEVTLEGKVKKIFSAFSKIHNEDYLRIRKSIEEKNNKSAKARYSVSNYSLWSNFLIDENDNIYVLLLIKEKNNAQELFAFSPEGILLYKRDIYFFNNKRILKFFCSKDDFAFINFDQEIIFAKKRR